MGYFTVGKDEKCFPVFGNNMVIEQFSSRGFKVTGEVI